MTRSLFFTLAPDGTLAFAASMEQAILEVLSIPEDETDDSALAIAESVLSSGVIAPRARAGTRGGPIRITWAALVEKGVEAGVLEIQDA